MKHLTSSFLALLAIASQLVAGQAEGQPVLVEFSVMRADTGERLSSPAVVSLRAATGEGDALEFPVGPSYRIPTGVWLVTPRASGYWSFEQPIVVDSSPSGPLRQVLWVWPSVPVGGRLVDVQLKTGSAGAVVADSVKVAFRSSPSDKGMVRIPPSSMECKITRSLEWACRLPAGRLDVKLQVDNCIPSYYWDLDIAAKRNLPPFDLIKGASVAGFVVDEASVPVKAGVSVELRSPAGEVILGAQLPTHTRERGFFQIAPVRAATYVLRTTAGARFAEHGLVVEPEIEHFLAEPLMLSPPLQLEVVIRPAVRPSGAPWGVQLIRMRRTDPRMIDEIIDEFAPVPADGAWFKSGLAAGTYAITVLAGSAASRVATQTVSMIQAEQLLFDLPVAEITGRLTLGETPLNGTVVFGGQFGSVSIPFQSNDDGDFNGYLYQSERSREWQVTVHSRSPFVHRSVERVLVELQDGRAHVNILLPANRLSGRVVTQDGLPFSAGGAIVSLRGTGGGAADERANWIQLGKAEHQFVLEGLSPGIMVVSARAGSLRSKEETIALANEDEAEVTLVLAPTPALRFEVRGEDRTGVPGARIKYLPANAPESGAPTATTGLDGTVDVNLPPGTREVLASVWSLGYAYSIGRYRIGDDQRVTINMQRVGGTLEIVDVKDPVNITDAVPVLVTNGAFESVRHLRTWARINGGNDLPNQVLIPSLAAGRYHLCLVGRSDLSALVSGGFVAGHCESTTVSPGRQALLRSLPRR